MTKRPSPSMVVALLALFVALSGVAWAASVAKNSVTSKSIRNGQVKSADVKDGDLRSIDVRDGELGSADVRDNSLTGADIDEGTLSSPGIDGIAAGGDLSGTYPNPQVNEAGLGTVPNADALDGRNSTDFETWTTESIPSGTTVTGLFAEAERDTGVATSIFEWVALPGLAASSLNNLNVNFAPGFESQTTDEDTNCTGSFSDPTAPSGQVCIYPSLMNGVIDATGYGIPSDRGFEIQAAGDGAVQVAASWAYTQP